LTGVSRSDAGGANAFGTTEKFPQARGFNAGELPGRAFSGADVETRMIDVAAYYVTS